MTKRQPQKFHDEHQDPCREEPTGIPPYLFMEFQFTITKLTKFQIELRITDILEALIAHNVPLLHLLVKASPDMDDTWKQYEGEQITNSLVRLYSSKSCDYLKTLVLPSFSS